MNIPISVIIVTYNRSKLLIKAIDSVLNQKFTEFELIIIDDASNDDTEEVIKIYLGDKRVRYIKNEKGNSIAQVRNYAWQYVHGEYIAVLDSDDIWCNDLKLTMQYEYLKNHPEVVLIGGGSILINEKGEELSRIMNPVNDEEIRKDFMVKNPICHSTVMYRYDAVKKLGGYDEKIKYGEDLDLWLRMGKIGKLHNLPEYLIKYRVHHDNESSKHFWEAIFDVLKVIGKNRKEYGVGWIIYFKKIIQKFMEYYKR